MSVLNGFSSLNNLDEQVVSFIKSNSPNKNFTYPQTGIAEHDQFFSDIKSYLVKRRKLGHLNNDGYCAFVYVPIDLIRKVEHLGSEDRKVHKNMTLNLKNKIILSLGAGCNLVRVISFDNLENPWSKIMECIDSINVHCGRFLSYVVSNFEIPVIDLYVDEDDDAYRTFKLDDNGIKYTIPELQKFADTFHRKETIYPTSRLRIWESAKDYQLASKAEDKIVVRFAAYLEDTLGPEHVIYESTKSSGRPDIVISSSALVDEKGACVLEFKVLKKDVSHKENRKWVLKGILQARDYAVDWEASSYFVMAYDAREKEVALEYVQKLSDKLKIPVKYYRMYNSSSDQRANEVKQIEASYQDDKF